MDSKPLKYNPITDLSVARSPAFGLTGGVPPVGSMWALIICEAQPVRWRDDGVAPTATVGNPMQAGESMVYDGNLKGIQFIQTAAGAALHVNFYKAPGQQLLPDDLPPPAPARPAGPPVPRIREGAYR